MIFFTSHIFVKGVLFIDVLHLYILLKTIYKNMFFGKNIRLNHKLTLNGMPIEWVSEWKYLGVVLESGPIFNCSVVDRVKAFYRALNSILCIEGRADNMILLQLLETHCLPILSYGMEVVHFKNRR